MVFATCSLPGGRFLPARAMVFRSPWGATAPPPKDTLGREEAVRDIRSITPRTRLCAVIGNPVAHSLSPAIHNAAYEALGLDFVYVAFRVEDLPRAIAGMRAFEGFRGLSVTIPHKIEVMGLVDEVAEVDRRIGAINTVVNEGGRLIGLGTDGPGALKALVAAGVRLEGRRVLLLGAGGAARAIAFTLARDAGPSALAILDVDDGLRERLAADLRAAGPVEVSSGRPDTAHLATSVAETDVVINCTPVGMHPHPDASLVPPGLLRPDQAVFDIVYTPLETRLLADARARGCTVVSGVEMFVNQAVLQFVRFTGVEVPVEVMRRVVFERLRP